MKKIGTLTLVAMFLSSISLAEPSCDKNCKSTWSQWFGDAMFMVLAYEGASARVPALQTVNTWVATKVTEYGPMLLTAIQGKTGKTAAEKTE
jgi:hypothetical protein